MAAVANITCIELSVNTVVTAAHSTCYSTVPARSPSRTQNDVVKPAASLFLSMLVTGRDPSALDRLLEDNAGL